MTYKQSQHRVQTLTKYYKKKNITALKKTLRLEPRLIARASLSAVPAKPTGRGFHNRLPKHWTPPKNTHKKHIIVTLAPTIDLTLPTRVLRTYERKKSRHNLRPIKKRLLLWQIPPRNKPRLRRNSGATIPIHVAQSGTNRKETELLCAVRFSHNCPQPIIKCLNPTGVGCVGFLRRGTLLKYPQTLSLIGQNFVLVCVRERVFFFEASDDSVFSKLDDCYHSCLVWGDRLWFPIV